MFRKLFRKKKAYMIMEVSLDYYGKADWIKLFSSKKKAKKFIVENDHDDVMYIEYMTIY